MKQDVEEYLKSLSDVPFILEESTTCSYTLNKKTIYLLFRNKDGGYFDWHTIITAALHEYAHIIDRDNSGHGPHFDYVLETLEGKACERYGFRCQFPSDPEYPSIKNQSC